MSDHESVRRDEERTEATCWFFSLSFTNDNITEEPDDNLEMTCFMRCLADERNENSVVIWEVEGSAGSIRRWSYSSVAILIQSLLTNFLLIETSLIGFLRRASSILMLRRAHRLMLLSIDHVRSMLTTMIEIDHQSFSASHTKKRFYVDVKRVDLPSIET
jgi:hypothetical protein